MADLDATAEETGELGRLCRYSLLYWPEYQNSGIRRKHLHKLSQSLSGGATSGLAYKVLQSILCSSSIPSACVQSHFLFLQIATGQARLPESQIPSRTASDCWVPVPVFSNPYGYRYLIIKLLSDSKMNLKTNLGIGRNPLTDTWINKM